MVAGSARMLYGKKAEQERKQKHYDSLQSRYRGAAQSPSKHNAKPRDRRHKSLFQKTELPVPYQLYAVEHCGKENAHCNYSGNAKIPPFSTLNETESTAARLPNFFVSPLTSIANITIFLNL